jgi:hypothetical protein
LGPARLGSNKMATTSVSETVHCSTLGYYSALLTRSHLVRGTSSISRSIFGTSSKAQSFPSTGSLTQRCSAFRGDMYTTSERLYLKLKSANLVIPADCFPGTSTSDLPINLRSCRLQYLVAEDCGKFSGPLDSYSGRDFVWKLRPGQCVVRIL